MKRVYAFSRKTVWIGFFAVAFLVGTSSFVNAQNTEVQQMRDRLKQLEDTVKELKTQLNTIEEEKKKSDAVPTTPTAPVAAQPADITPTDDKNGPTSLEVYGFAMLDAGYDFKTSNPNWFDVIRPTRLPSFGGEFAPNGKTYWGVRQSRLGVKSSTQTKLGELKTVFEFELFGSGADEGKTTFRIRHAYGELGKFGAGQYWTVFGDTDAYPNSFEYWGPNGLVWFRNVQARFMPLKGKNSITLALERPGASGDGGIYADRIQIASIKPRLTLPDFTGNVRFDRDWGHVQISGILRKIGWTDTRTVKPIDLSGDVLGVGGSVSSHLNFSKNNVGRFQVTYGKGIENYLNDAPIDVAIQNNPGNTARPIQGVALPIFGMSAFLDHTWSKKWTSAIGYSMVDINNSNGQANNAYRRGMYGLGNLIYSPVPNVVIGGELQWGRRENFRDNFASDDFRIQFSFKYNFSKKLVL